VVKSCHFDLHRRKVTALVQCSRRTVFFHHRNSRRHAILAARLRNENDEIQEKINLINARSKRCECLGYLFERVTPAQLRRCSSHKSTSTDVRDIRVVFVYISRARTSTTRAITSPGAVCVLHYMGVSRSDYYEITAGDCDASCKEDESDRHINILLTIKALLQRDKECVKRAVQHTQSDVFLCLMLLL
jgi:hypothetical protein